MYKKSVWEHKKTLSKLQSEVKEKHIQNQHLDQQVLECQVSVAEQQQVENLAGKLKGMKYTGYCLRMLLLMHAYRGTLI